MPATEVEAIFSLLQHKLKDLFQCSSVTTKLIALRKSIRTGIPQPIGEGAVSQDSCASRAID